MSIVPERSLKGLISNLSIYGLFLSIPSLIFFFYTRSPLAILIFLGGIWGSILMVYAIKLSNWWMTGEWEL